MNKNLVAFTVCLIFLSVLISWAAVQFASPSYLYLIVGVLAIATFIIYFFMEKTGSENFIKNYLLTIVLKLLAGGIFISVIIYTDLESAESNAISFMAAYLLFTVLEVVFLFKKFDN